MSPQKWTRTDGEEELERQESRIPVVKNGVTESYLEMQVSLLALFSHKELVDKCQFTTGTDGSQQDLSYTYILW